MNQDQIFEEIPEYIEENNPIEHIQEEPEIQEIEVKKEFTGIKGSLVKPSTLKVDQSYMIVDFETYKGDLKEIFAELSEVFKDVNNWDENTTFKITDYFLDKEFIEIINKIAYLPNNPHLPNIIEIIASLIENGNIELGAIIDTEVTFQNLKRLYNHRVQLILLPLLLYIYNLDKKLMPVKQSAWQILNKYGHFFEASIVMGDIQKSNIRIKKAEELLTQERYNLETKVIENIDLLMILSGRRSLLFPVYQAYKENLNSDDFDFDRYFSSAYNIDSVPVKPLSQQLITYKIGETGHKIMNQVMMWSGKNDSLQFRFHLTEILSDIINEIEIDSKNYPIIIKDIVFVITDTAKKKNWAIVETIRDLVVAIFSSANIIDKNDLRVLSYIISCQVISGVLKIKYKNEEAIAGLVKSLIALYIDSDSSEQSKMFTAKVNHKIICESFYNAIWDTSLEVYPNLINVEKNTELFANMLKSEVDNIK